ncbi:MAG TPA: DUF72 domain-containing protein [Polyangia bacterium]|nr:DUF72 domain-containing protein [Polyangia bacterium]
MPSARWLAYLASRFSTVEVNGSFYRLQRPEVFRRWREEVPGEFVFAVKGSRYVTHMLKLGGGAAPLGNFFAQGILALGRKLGPILWQLPESVRFDGERARAFLDGLPRDLREAERLARKHDGRVTGRAVLRAADGGDARVRHALEARHVSWLSDEALALLERYDVALVASETAGRFPLSFARTASFAYARLHGARKLYASRYTDEELAAWAARIRGWRDGGADVFVYFDNDYEAYAPGDARRLLDALGAARAAEPEIDVAVVGRKRQPVRRARQPEHRAARAAAHHAPRARRRSGRIARR